MDGQSEAVEVGELSDEALNELLTGGGAEAEPETTEGEAADAVNAEPPADLVVTDEQLADPNWNPEGPGNLKVAMRQAREAERTARAEAAETNRQLAEYQQREQRAQQEQRQRQYQHDTAQRNADRAAALDDVYDPAERQQLLSQWHQEDLNAVSQQVQQLDTQREYERGFRDAKALIPDFDAVFDKGRADPATYRAMNYAAEEALSRGENPVVAAYKEAKSRDPEATKAQIAAEVARQVQEILQKQKPPDIKGHKGIAHISSEAPGKSGEKPLHKLSDEELNARLGVGR